LGGVQEGGDSFRDQSASDLRLLTVAQVLERQLTICDLA
jgi:hypothetical protein